MGKLDDECVVLPEWSITVKQTFIEVAISPCQQARRRSMSDGAALARFEMVEKPWKSIVSDELQDLSDASTNISLEGDLSSNYGGSSTREDIGQSSDGEEQTDAFAHTLYPSDSVTSGTASPASGIWCEP